MDNYPSSSGTKSEIGSLGPHVPHRYRRDGGSHSYGTLERATSYSSLVARTGGTLFRSANSPRPLPAPPCTTAEQDPCRHVAPPLPAVQAKSRLPSPRGGSGTLGTPFRSCISSPQCVNGTTPRASNPQLAPHVQNTFTRERKVSGNFNFFLRSFFARV